MIARLPLRSLILPVLLIALWQVWGLGLPEKSRAPLPVEVIEAAGRLIGSGALPHILTGARIAGGAVWMALVAAELIGAPSGLGFAIEWYRQLLMTPKVIAFILVISVLGYLTDRALRWLQQRLTPWATGIGAAE